MKKVVWGVLSTAKIGMEKVIPAMQGSQWCDMRAIASRDLPKAQAAAAQLGMPKAYGSYEAMLADPEIEAIYNPLPNDQHVPWTLAAARAGKHVLCEKPFAMNAGEAAQLREVADKVHIMEAFMVRFHPQWLQARQTAKQGNLGELRALQVYFSYFNTDAHNIRNQLATGGGALYDIGCYAVVAGRFLFDTEPLRVVALADPDPQFKTDRTFSALLDFGNGRRLDFTVSTQTAPYQRLQLIGTKGRLELKIPFNAPLGGSTDWSLDTGAALGDASALATTVPACNMYGLQGDAFSLAVRSQAPLPYGVEDAICNMKVLDALFESVRTQGWVTVA